MGAVLKRRSKYLSSCLSIMTIVAVSYPSSSEIVSAFTDDRKPTQEVSTESKPESDSVKPETSSEDKVIIPEKPDPSLMEKLDERGFEEFQATAYCLKGRTASGEMVRPGIIAADPRVLPLGTVVRIRAGRYSGTYKVADTGGLIKGRKVDIYIPTYKEAIRFGRQRVKIKVIAPAPGKGKKPGSQKDPQAEVQ